MHEGATISYIEVLVIIYNSIENNTDTKLFTSDDKYSTKDKATFITSYLAECWI